MSLEYLRSFRVSGIAMFDYVMSYIGFAIFFQIFGLEHSIRNYLLVIPISLVVHVITRQDTILTGRVLNNELNLSKLIVILTIFYIVYLSL